MNQRISKERFGWDVFFATPSLYSGRNRDFSNLQTHNFSPLATNIALHPASSWFHYHQSIYFDYETATAYMQIVDESQTFAEPAVESLVASLDYVADLNKNFGCFDPRSPGNDGFAEEGGGSSNSRCTVLASRCWSPIVFIGKSAGGQYEECLEAALSHPHPPLVFYAASEHGIVEERSSMIVNNTIIYHPSDSVDIISHLRIELGQYDTSKMRQIGTWHPMMST